MQKPLPRIGSLEAQFFAWVQLKGLSIVRSGDMVRALSINRQREARLLSGLSRRQLILRLSNGLYLAPSKLPPGGRWGPNPYWVLTQLMEAISAEYQVSGPDAFHRYDYTEQVPNVVTVYNTKLSGRKTIGGISYQLIKVARARLGDAEFLTITDSVKIPFASPGRALLDAIYDWSRFGTIPKAFEWVKDRSQDHELIASLIKAAVRFGNVGTIRRVGYILAASGVEENKLRPLRKRLKKTKSYPPLIPSSPKRGHIDQAWGLVING